MTRRLIPALGLALVLVLSACGVTCDGWRYAPSTGNARTMVQQYTTLQNGAPPGLCIDAFLEHNHLGESVDIPDLGDFQVAGTCTAVE